MAVQLTLLAACLQDPILLQAFQIARPVTPALLPLHAQGHMQHMCAGGPPHAGLQYGVHHGPGRAQVLPAVLQVRVPQPPVRAHQGGRPQSDLQLCMHPTQQTVLWSGDVPRPHRLVASEERRAGRSGPLSLHQDARNPLYNACGSLAAEMSSGSAYGIAAVQWHPPPKMPNGSLDVPAALPSLPHSPPQATDCIACWCQ